jgi:ribonuclease P protein subunit POP4
MSTISDQKKRTLEAIQQRYAAAKAKKVQDEQLKCQKSKDGTPKPKFDVQKKGKTPELTPSRTSTPKGLICQPFSILVT